MSTFFSLHPFATALFASVVLGIPVFWSEFLHYWFQGRVHYSVTLFGSMVSILWAAGWGIWGMPPPHSN
jgi:hypothetical protein